MPTEFASLDEFGAFWSTRFHDETESILNVFTMGLGGPSTSTQLRQFLRSNCIRYNKIYIFAFGKSGPDESRTVDELREIEALSDEVPTCRGRFETYFLNDYIPINYQLGTTPKITVTHMFELQFDGVSYTYYLNSRNVPRIEFYNEHGESSPAYSTAQRNKVSKIIQHWGDFWRNVLNGQLVIDNNAFIRSTGFETNLNFEYMPWIPKVLALHRSTGRIFQLKKPRLRTAEVPILQPFFEEAAVYKRPAEDLYQMLKFNSLVPIDLIDPLKAETIDAAGIDERTKRERLLFYYNCRKNNRGLNALPNFVTRTCPPIVPVEAPEEPNLRIVRNVEPAAAAPAGAALEAIGGAGVGGRRRKARQSRRRQKMSRRRRY
jgi:hypothetical protein